MLVVDSDTVRRSLQSQVPGIPYWVLRPVVHAVHWARIAVLAVAETGPLLIHETATRPTSRALLVRIAWCTRRPARMVWIDVDAETARRGQVARDRMIRPRAFRRHLRWVGTADPPVAAADTWDAVSRTDRANAVQTIKAAMRTVDPVVDS